MLKAIDNSLFTVIAVDDNQTVGMGRLIGDGMYYMIADIVVFPAYQNKGIGTKITNMIIEYVKNKTPIGGRSSIHLIAQQGKERFYEKLGFKALRKNLCKNNQLQKNDFVVRAAALFPFMTGNAASVKKRWTIK